MRQNSLRMYELLGAGFFQKVVLKIEDLKYTIIDRLFPNSRDKYEEFCNKKCKRVCAKVSSEQEKQAIVNYYKIEKLRYRKELVARKNRNYHLDFNRPDETIGYLNMNKRIHKSGMIKDGIFIAVSSVALLFTGGIAATIAAVVLGVNCVGLLVDFQCVNLQNYNLKRLEMNEASIRLFAQKRQERNIQKYGDAATVIATELAKTDTIPEPSSIVASTNNLDQLMQMRELLLTYIRSDNDVKEVKVGKEGGQGIK